MKNKICILGNTGKNINNAYSWFCKTTYQGMILNGHEVVGFDYKTHTIDQIRDFLFDYQPNILFTHLTMHKHHDKFEVMEIFDELRNVFDTKIIHTLQDAREEPRYKGDISYAFDMALISTYKNLDKFQKYWKIPVHYWPYSSLTYKKMGIYKSNLNFNMPVFPGNPDSHPDRTDFIRRLSNVMKIKIIKTKSRDDIREKTLDFSASNPCVLCLSTRYEMNNGFTDTRPFQYGGAGAIMLGRPHDIQKNIIPENLWFPFYSYNDINYIKELWEKIQKMTKLEKNKMRNDVFNFIQTYHSSGIRMKQTLELIEGKRNKLDIFLDEI